jgi:tetratricopeptide (TPR) repeat protein
MLLLWKFIDEDRLRAIDHFNRATKIDPAYAAPYAGLAHAWWMQGVLGPVSIEDVREPARAAAQKALELNDRLAEAYAAQAYVQGMFDWDWAGAEATIRRAVDLDPNSLDAHYVYALLLMALGRLPEATTYIEHAAQLDPLSAQVHSTFGRILYRARKFDEAILRLNRAIELEPRNPQAYDRLGDVYDQMGKYPDALAFYEKSRALLANPESGATRMARVYAHMGRVRESRQMLKSLGDGYEAAEVYAALGDKDMAFRLLIKTVEERSDWHIFIKRDPSFDTLHSDPRWKELLRRMNLPPTAVRRRWVGISADREPGTRLPASGQTADAVMRRWEPCISTCGFGSAGEWAPVVAAEPSPCLCTSESRVIPRYDTDASQCG